VKEVIHVVDMFPTLTELAGGSAEKAKPLDGLNIWSTISEGKLSPRQGGGLQHRAVLWRGAQRRLETGLADSAPVRSGALQYRG